MEVDVGAKNRLIAVTPKATVTAVGWKRCEFSYDYLGRRVEKRGYTCDTASDPPANWPLTKRSRFIWGSASAGHEWLMLMEIVERDTDANETLDEVRTRRYTWGRDLSAQSNSVTSVTSVAGLSATSLLTSAGGIGGLLAVDDDNATTTGGSPTTDDLHYVYMYDANGNVGQVVDWAESTASASLKAKYEYDVYGNVTASSGAFASTNPFRFSTKFWDDETGLGYWGYRYYDPRLGRWISRDPIGEAGGTNAYQLLSNRPVNDMDAVGLQATTAPLSGIGGARITHFDDCCGFQRDTARQAADRACGCVRTAKKIVESDALWQLARGVCGKHPPALIPFNSEEVRGVDYINKVRTELRGSLAKLAGCCNNGFGIECEESCKVDVFAYSGWAQDLHLCPIFFSDLSADEQTSTVIHELSHKCAGTNHQGGFGVGGNAYNIEHSVMDLCECGRRIASLFSVIR